MSLILRLILEENEDDVEKEAAEMEGVAEISTYSTAACSGAALSGAFEGPIASTPEPAGATGSQTQKEGTFLP